MFVSVSAATNCRYFFINVVWSTTVGLGAGTNAMVPAGRDRAAMGVRADTSLHRSYKNRMHAAYKEEMVKVGKLFLKSAHTSA